jgi:hypothetical protein
MSEYDSVKGNIRGALEATSSPSIYRIGAYYGGLHVEINIENARKWCRSIHIRQQFDNKELIQTTIARRVEKKKEVSQLGLQWCVS